MSGKTRRAAAVAASQKMEKIDSKNSEDVGQEEDDDAPPPILERETSCGENDDTDGDGGGSEESSTTATSSKKRKLPEESTENLLERLSHVFNADGPTSSGEIKDPFPKITGKRKKSATPDVMVISGGTNGRTPVPRSTLLKNPAPRTPIPMSSTKFAPLRQFSNGKQAMSRKFGYPPPVPNALKTGVGSNTSLGPLKLLESRKRQIEQERLLRRSALVTYNGGRAGENFRQISIATTSKSPPSSSSTTSSGVIDVHTMLREQSPVKIQVSAGGDHEEETSNIQETPEFQKEAMANIAKASSNHTMLLGSMVMNGLNTLQDRDSEEYSKFSADLFALFTKYRIN